MQIKNPPLVALIGVAVVGVLAAVVLFAVANAGLTGTYDFATGDRVGGMSGWVAVIPLAIGAIAGIAALVLWGTQRTSSTSPRSTPETGLPRPADSQQSTPSEPA